MNVSQAHAADPDLRYHANKNTRSDLVFVAICLLLTAQAIDALTSDWPLAATIAAANAPFDHSIEPFRRR